jgi:hypothetical protein
MTKWEYFVLQCDKTKRDWLSERLNKLGSQGWEAVGIGGGLGLGYRGLASGEGNRNPEDITKEASTFMIILKRELSE